MPADYARDSVTFRSGLTDVGRGIGKPLRGHLRQPSVPDVVPLEIAL